VLRLLGTGKSNSELRSALYVGEGTVKAHVSKVLTKLGLRDRVQAVIFAYESGLIERAGLGPGWPWRFGSLAPGRFRRLTLAPYWPKHSLVFEGIARRAIRVRSAASRWPACR
jgi:hypothetical protein